MKMRTGRIILTCFFLCTSFIISYGQRLTLTDLTNLCSKKNWEDVNQILLSKKWTYFESAKGNGTKYNTITWSFNKDYYTDKANGWFYLYTYEGFPNKISYSVFNKESYSLIQSSISTAGFKLLKSEIEDNQVISVYSNSGYTLSISTEKRTDSEWDDRSLTAYEITLVKKSGIYDDDNGRKVDYYFDDVVKAEYTLRNGEIDGKLTVYHENGKLKKIGNYINGVENGKFIEYGEDGGMTSEYTMLNGKQAGLCVWYEHNRISHSLNFKDDLMNGTYIEYYYGDNGVLALKVYGEYLNDEKNGVWKTFIVEDKGERLLTLTNYTNGIKNGAFQDVKKDTLKVGTYRNDKLHGTFKGYLDVAKSLLGGSIRTNISELTLVVDGSYNDGLKSGNWRYYDMTGSLKREGWFSEGLKNGEWRYYYTKWVNDKGAELPYSRKLYLVENYAKGLLHGKSSRYSSLDQETYPCTDIDKTRSSLDTCTRLIFEKLLETAFYKDGDLHGPFELKDSTNEIVALGGFKNGLKDGPWVQRYRGKYVNDQPYFFYEKGSYNNDKKDGQWSSYLEGDHVYNTRNFRNGILNGEYIEWVSEGKPREKKVFSDGKLKELTVFDSIEYQPETKYEIYDESDKYLKCKRTRYYEDSYSWQEYRLVKDRGEISHDWFEIIFLLSISDTTSSTKGFRDGQYQYCKLNGEPIVTGRYYKQDKVGLWTHYYAEQGIKIENNYLEGRMAGEKYFRPGGEPFTGEFILTNEETGIKEVRKIKDGLRNGKTIFIDVRTSKTIKKETYSNGNIK